MNTTVTPTNTPSISADMTHNPTVTPTPSVTNTVTPTNTTDSRIAVFQSILETQSSKSKFDNLLPGSYDSNTDTFTVTGLKDSDLVITHVSGNTYNTQMSTTKTYVYVSSDGNPLNNTQIQSLSTNFVPEFEQAGFTNGEILVFLPR